MTRSEYNEALEIEIKKFLDIDKETPIEIKGESVHGVYVYSMKKVVGFINKNKLSEIKKKVGGK